jgi:hypothetical protein
VRIARFHGPAAVGRDEDFGGGDTPIHLIVTGP